MTLAVRSNTMSFGLKTHQFCSLLDFIDELTGRNEHHTGLTWFCDRLGWSKNILYMYSSYASLQAIRIEKNKTPP
jgi:hypothetical protein